MEKYLKFLESLKNGRNDALVEAIKDEVTNPITILKNSAGMKKILELAIKMGVINDENAYYLDPLNFINCDEFPLLQHASKAYINDSPIAPIEYGTMTDPRDGHTYKTIRIGLQTWMAENLAYKCMGSYAYENDESNVETYGRLYTWYAAMNVAPPGWHLPTIEEWQQLSDYLGDNIAGKLLKAESFGGLDIGFCALPAGCRTDYGDFFRRDSIDFWSASEYDSAYCPAYGRFFILDYEDGLYRIWVSGWHAHSVRLVRDSR